LDFLVLFVGFDLGKEAGEPYGFAFLEWVFVSFVKHWMYWAMMIRHRFARVLCWLWAS